jgi:nuclease S1
MIQLGRRVILHRLVAVSTTVFLVLTPTAPAWAWGRQCHRILAKFAQTRLKPPALAKIRDLLEEGEDIAAASNWPDEHSTPRDAPWHYVNIPLESSGYDPMFCDPSRGCVVAKIKEFVKVLKDPNADRLDKRRALRFVIHLVGDIHQPLHSADNKDRGGTQLQVRYFDEGTNLHAVWDFQILMFDPQSHPDGRGETVDENAWVTRLVKFTSAARRDKWSENKAVEDWANESLRLAKQA